MHLFGNKKHKNVNITILNHKDEYYKHIWFNKRLCNTIDYLSKASGKTKRATAKEITELFEV
jgi:hypothetical protein